MFDINGAGSGFGSGFFVSFWCVNASCFLGFVLHIFVASHSLFLLVFLDTLRSNKNKLPT